MIKVAVTGAGKIGTLITCLLLDSEDYEVHLLDVALKGSDLERLCSVFPDVITKTLNVKNEDKMTSYFKEHKITSVLSSLPYYLTLHVARAAQNAGINYFDLTEDVHTTREVKKIAANQPMAFVPQCGLAPGFVGIVTNGLIKHFDEVDEVKLRVGALPQCASNGLHYSLTWSTDGLINEYCNPCIAIEEGKIVSHSALEGLEIITLEGATYEAFNTSGGLGSLPELYEHKIKNLNYKTIRYKGHHDKVFFLIQELMMKYDQENLKIILERAIPRTYQDVVVIYVSVRGKLKGENFEKNYFKKFYPTAIRGLNWSAIQVCTAAGICAIADLVLEEECYQGFVYQEQFDLKKILMNRFGRHFS